MVWTRLLLHRCRFFVSLLHLALLALPRSPLAAFSTVLDCFLLLLLFLSLSRIRVQILLFMRPMCLCELKFHSTSCAHVGFSFSRHSCECAILLSGLYGRWASVIEQQWRWTWTIHDTTTATMKNRRKKHNLQRVHKFDKKRTNTTAWRPKESPNAAKEKATNNEKLQQKKQPAHTIRYAHSHKIYVTTFREKKRRRR